MDHQQAINMHAAERYLLNELPPAERNEFEEHYFSCVGCADEVRSAFVFADNAKAVQLEQARSESRRPVPPRPRRVFDWTAWLRPAMAAPVAAALLLGVTLYQRGIVIPRLEGELETATQPRVLPSVVARPATRGEEPVVEIGAKDRFFQLILDINPIVPVSSYLCEVYDESGTLKFAVPAPVPARGGSLSLLLSASELRAGRYTIRVWPLTGAGSKSEPHLDDYSFVLHLN